MNDRPQSAPNAALSLVPPLIALLLAVVLVSRPARKPESVYWIHRHLSTEEVRQIHSLASRIAAAPSEPSRSAPSLRANVRQLSIREAAGLGAILLEDHGIDPAPWLALPHAREQEATARLTKLLRRFGSEPGYPTLETTIRGPKRLREACSEALLTEVTRVGFWKFYDGSIPAPTSFGDDDVDVLLDLPGLERITANWSKLADDGVIRLASLERLRELRIAGANVGDRALQALGRNPHLRVLDLSGAKQITDAGVASLGACRRLETLDLSETGITSASLGPISRLHELRALSLRGTAVREDLSRLRTLNKLRRLDLSKLGSHEAPVPFKELAFLSDLKQLRSLLLKQTAVERLTLRGLPDLSLLRLGHAALRHVTLVNLPKIEKLEITSSLGKEPPQLAGLTVRGLPAVTQIVIQGLNGQAADGLAQALPSMPRVTAVFLGRGMSDRLAHALGSLPQLERLGLDEIGVTDRQLALTAQAPRLSFLNVEGASLSSAGVNSLRHAPSLTRLQLEGIVLDDAGILTELPSLTSLRLERCRIGTLRLGASTALGVLDIRGGSIHELTARACPQPLRLSLSTCRVGRLTVEACPGVTSLFCGSRAVVDELQLRNLSQLSSLTIQEGTALGDIDLLELPKLKTVTFWAAEVKTKHIEALVGLPSLERLDLSGTGLEDDAAGVVAQLRSLRHLGASGSFGIKGLQELTGIETLRSLFLYHSPHSDWTPGQARRLFTHVPEVVVF